MMVLSISLSNCNTNGYGTLLSLVMVEFSYERMDDKTPNAYEEAWDVIGGTTASSN